MKRILYVLRHLGTFRFWCAYYHPPFGTLHAISILWWESGQACYLSKGVEP